MNLEQFKNPDLSSEVLYWIDHNLRNYLDKKDSVIITLTESTIEHVLDYLNSDESPKRLKKMSVPEALNAAEKWTAKLVKKASKVIETEEDTEVVLNFENGFKLVRLVGKNAFDREGSLMRHCVSSYHGKENCKIYSLRDLNNNPHCTLEVLSAGEINQIKGKGNGSIHPKYIDMVLQSLEYFGMKVKSRDMSNLGYHKISEELMHIIDRDFIGAKWLTFGNERYFYKYCKLCKIPRMPSTRM